MTKTIITCDREGDYIRAATWAGAELCDLYVDRAGAPDFSGATARGKIARVTNGGKAAWIECGLAEKVYIESAKPLHAGEVVTVRIRATMTQGKAWLGEMIKGEAGAAGLLTPPPLPWLRALADLKEAAPRATFRFSDREMFECCRASCGDQAEFSKLPVHPQLDDMMEALLRPVVMLSGGANIVIERTHALVAIDVNGGEKATNPTAINLLAVREAARQIRLRNLSGIIVIDALKMKDRADISKTLNAFSRASEGDPAGVRVFSMTKLGLLEATRTRRGPALCDVVSGEDL